jgi:predicted DNA-binding transcriptional regulator AlpA
VPKSREENRSALASQRLVSMKETLAIVRASRPTLYRWMKAKPPTFPRPVKLGKHMIAFREAELLEWLESRTRALGGEPAPDQVEQAA